MGWLFKHGASKADIVADIVRPCESAEGYSKTIKHCVRGNAVYAVREVCEAGKEPVRFILVALLGKERGCGWGYKDMDEGMGPYHYGCPVGYLDLCTAPVNEYAAKYRETIRARAAIRGRKLAVGDKVKLTNGWEVEIIGLKPLSCRYNGINYRLPRKLLAGPGSEAA